VYAVVETGGKQYRADPGKVVDVEKLPVDVGSQVTLDRVLMVADGDNVRVGQPVLAGVQVLATVISQGRTRKVTWFHYSQKKRERKKGGHRQAFTRLRIDQVQA
jgi:large subunit ribosomal protein L21